MTIRRLERSDLDFAAHLTVREGWNYTSHEIGRMLELDPDGSFVYEDGEPLGFVTCVTYGGTGVIGHLIVSSRGRGKGIGQALVDAALGYLDDAEAESILVYSTQDGRKLYEKFGFAATEDIYCVHLRLGKHDERHLLPECSPVQEGDIDRIISVDQDIFGDDRTKLIRNLYSSFPRGAFKLERKGRMEGYVFIRPDHIGYDLGPWTCLSGSDSDAQALFDAAMSLAREGIIYMGAFCKNSAAVHILGQMPKDNSWIIPLMVRGQPRYTGDLAKMFGLAAFELG